MWNRRRFQLGIGLLLAVIAPWILRLELSGPGSDLRGLETAVVGTTVALLAGYYGFQRLSVFPGARASYHILPSFAISYGLVLVGFFWLSTPSGGRTTMSEKLLVSPRYA